MEFDDLSRRVIGCAIEVHKVLGAGLLESTYEKCLEHELHLAGLSYSVQQQLPVNYKGVELDCGYRLDLVVENKLIVELKSVEKLQKIHEAQILTYMKLTGLNVGLLINFNETLLKNGVKRFVI
jgi:GxxExxY protein